MMLSSSSRSPVSGSAVSQHPVENAGVTRVGIAAAGVDDAGDPLPDVGLVGIVLAFAFRPNSFS